MCRSCLAFAFILSVCSPPPALRAADKSALRDALALEAAIEDAIKQAEPSIACILVSRSDAYQKIFHEPPPPNPGQLGPFMLPRSSRSNFPFRRRFNPQREELKKYDLADPDNVPEAYGSGVVLDGEKLLILTNYHVVRDATKIYVRLPGHKGSYADIHAADPRSDLAVLRLLDTHLRPLPPLKFGDGGNVRKGQFVVALSNPFAAGFRDGSPSASWGILSNIHRRAAGNPEEDKRIPLHVHPVLLQTDARLNLGCSGGALLNLRGELIGLTTARAAINGSETAGGFAIPFDTNLQRVVARLRDGREVEYGFLGVGSSEVSQEGDGVVIGRITGGSPAAKAELRSGERIVSVNGSRVHDFEDLVLVIGTLMAGSKVDLKVQNGSTRIVPVTLAKLYVPGPIIASNRPAPVRGIRVDYTSVLMLKYPGQSSVIQPGVFVSEVETGSPAAAKLKEGDIITQIKVRGVDVPVHTPDEFYREVAKLSVREPLWLTLLNSPEPVGIDD
jgi:serine protease Do